MTMNLERRIIDHFTKLNTGKHVNRLLQEDYIKYGRKSFVYRPLTEVKGLREARQKEKELIKKYNTENTGYNMVSNKKKEEDIKKPMRTGLENKYRDLILKELESKGLKAHDWVREAILEKAERDGIL